MNLKYPDKLHPGDKVALTAPSSPVTEKLLDSAIKSIRFLGLEPEVMPSCRLRHGYMAGTDTQRASDLNQAFSDKNIKGIFCLRGGYGITRILPMLDFEMIRNNPKPLIGFSDVTALHNSLNQLCGFITYHGPMPNADYTKLDDFSLTSLKNCLFSPDSRHALENPASRTFEILHEGKACGILTGGNLSMLTATLGSPYEIDTKDRILFIEEVGERPYRIDKMLTALSLAGKFRDCSGIIFGTFTDCDDPSPEQLSLNAITAGGSLTVKEIIEEVVLPYKKPVLWGLQAGHSYPNITLPMGARISMDPDDKSANLQVL